MRKITQLATTAFINNTPFNLSNTQVTHKDGVTCLKLYGHIIAIKDKDGLRVTTAGYDTVTTKERLSGLVTVQHIKKVLHLNDEVWDGSLTKIA